MHAPYAAATLQELLAAASNLCEIVLIFTRATVEAFPSFFELSGLIAETHLVENARDPRCYVSLDLDGITTVHDALLEPVDAVVAELDYAGAMSVAGPWDKLNQRTLLAAAGVTSVSTLAIGSPEEFLDAAAQQGLPGVLKPRRSTGGVGLAFINTQADVAMQLKTRESWQGLVYEELIPMGNHPSGRRWLADYVSVETVSTFDRHMHVAIFDKGPLAVAPAGYAPLMHSVLETADFTPTQLPDAVQKRLLRMTDAALNALGVNWRVTHTEFRVSDGQIELIEVNGRLGGEVVRILSLLDGPDMARAVLAVALGLDPDLDQALEPGYAGSLKVPLRHRYSPVRSTVTRADIRKLPGIVGADLVAVAGDKPDVTGFRAVDVSFRASDTAALEQQFSTTLDGIADLFAADGLVDDPWLSEMRRSANSIHMNF
ncbi:MAG TPA: hypothetical protein VK488_03995 [Gaiellaceae bacterium]|nr:hypothetical protein [Gaiellaceae bacterium]